MEKKPFVIKIPKDLDKKFREEVKRQGKQYNLSLEEAIRLWIKENEQQDRE